MDAATAEGPSTNGSTPEMLRAARRYHSYGLSIFAVPAGAKKANRPWKRFQTQRADDSQLKRWFGTGQLWQPAVIFGQASGWLACRDFDQMEAYDRWSDAYPDLSKQLPTVATPRPGRHVYLKDSTAVGRIVAFDDGEFRGAGYCLLPPSTNPQGRYEWLTPFPDDGDIPLVDPVEAGLLRCNTEDTGGLRDLKTLSEDQMHSDVQQCPVSTMSAMSSMTSAPSVLHDAIKRTLPSAKGQRHKKIFAFAQELKAIPSLADAPLSELKPYVQAWHKQALPKLGTKPFEETWFDFAEAWPNVKFAKGQGPIAELLAKADAAEMPDAARQYEQEPLRRLIKLCRELQHTNGDQPFFLGCRTIESLLGVHPATASRWMKGLQVDRVIELVKAGSLKEHMASLYLYRERP